MTTIYHCVDLKGCTHATFWSKEDAVWYTKNVNSSCIIEEESYDPKKRKTSRPKSK